MPYIDWCRRPCADCCNPCAVDESMPCSPDCKNLLADGSQDTEKCVSASCDAIIHHNHNDLKDDEYMCCLHETPRTFEWCEENCERYYSCDTVAWANDKWKEKYGDV